MNTIKKPYKRVDYHKDTGLHGALHCYDDEGIIVDVLLLTKEERAFQVNARARYDCDIAAMIFAERQPKAEETPIPRSRVRMTYHEAEAALPLVMALAGLCEKRLAS